MNGIADPADLAWCVFDDGETVLLYAFHDWVDWVDRPADLPIRPDRQNVTRLRWCKQCRKYEAEREGPTV